MAAEGKAAKFYSLKHSMTGSSFQVGVTTRPTSERSQLKLEIKTVDGTSCGYDSPSVFNTSYSQQLLSGVVSTASREYNDEECATKDLVLSVAQTDWSQADAGTPMQIDVMELPAATNAADLPQAADDATWVTMPAAGTPRTATGGTSLATATEVEPGTVGFNLVPGELRFFKVPAAWGQQVQAMATAEANPAYEKGYHRLTLDVLSPVGGDAADSSANELPKSDGMSLTDSRSATGDGVAVGTTSYPIRLNNRTTYGNAQGSSAPGDYYVAVGLSLNSSSGSPEPTSPLAMTLQIATPGTAGSGAPAFANGAAIKTASGTTLGEQGTGAISSPPTASESSASASSSGSGSTGQSGTSGPQEAAVAAGQPEAAGDDGGTNWLLIGAGGGTALLAALGVLAAVMLRRS